MDLGWDGSLKGCKHVAHSQRSFKEVSREWCWRVLGKESGSVGRRPKKLCQYFQQLVVSEILELMLFPEEWRIGESGGLWQKR